MIRIGYKTTGYRTEQLFGEGYRDAASVMAHEVFELQNCDILDTLSDTILEKSSCADSLKRLSSAITSDGSDDEKIENLLNDAYEDENVGIEYFNGVLDEIKRVTGKDIKYALWLCDSIDDVKHNYELEDEFTEFDEYNTSDIVLSYCGTNGVLYGYDNLPISNKNILTK